MPMVAATSSATIAKACAQKLPLGSLYQVNLPIKHSSVGRIVQFSTISDYNEIIIISYS